MFDSTRLAEKVNNLSISSASNILEIGLAFFEAKAHLNDQDYRDFLILTKYTDKSSMIRKWNGIGKCYQRLKAILKHLPPVFTTIYKLSTISPHDLDRLLASGVLTQSVSTREIIEELQPRAQRQKFPRIVVEFNDRSCEIRLKQLFDLIESEYSSFVTVQMNEDAKNLLDAASKKYQQLRKVA
jgi:hypothetical protein